MNQLIELKGRFQQKKNQSRPGTPMLPKGASVSLSHLNQLYDELKQMKNYWTDHANVIGGALVSILYDRVIAKSRRVQAFFRDGSRHTSNESIVGARFAVGETPKHIITHYVNLDILNSSLSELRECIHLMEADFPHGITAEEVGQIGKNEKKFSSGSISKTTFLQMIVDSFYVEHFAVPEPDIRDIPDLAMVTLYRTEQSVPELLDKLGITLLPGRCLDDMTVMLKKNQIEELMDKAPYLISMALKDLNEVSPDSVERCTETQTLTIPDPKYEPVIGVIDYPFDSRVYFSKWVEFHDERNQEIPSDPEDAEHGTAVSSLIVDGPAFNPELDDGCGRFRVRHFAVASGKRISASSVIRTLQKIIPENPDIKVWNLSLGSLLEVSPNYISPVAAVLDRIQYENDVIFVVSGTNKNSDVTDAMRIGDPADSLNSITVNSVNMEKKPASYTRIGEVLSFFHKPDISYYGGDRDRAMCVCSSCGKRMACGTSFAAPWISRKMAYLTEVMHMPRTIAKALLIDSAVGWKRSGGDLKKIGYGVVPIRIEEILHSPDDEMKLLISGEAKTYDTYNYQIPVPIADDKYPYIARAVLCYYPCCSRNQGVDYTNTEMDVHFGRVHKKTSDKWEIKSINNNTQDEEGCRHTERDARKLYRKWDNVKYMVEYFKEKAKGKKVYPGSDWGISIKTKERLAAGHEAGLLFGVVITLKAIDHVNRLDQFIQACSYKGWLVQKVDVRQHLDVYEKAEENIHLE